MENKGFQDDDLALSSEIPAPFSSISINGSQRTLQEEASDHHIGEGYSIQNTTVKKDTQTPGEYLRKPGITTTFSEDDSGYTRKETVVYGQKGKAEVTFINIELRKDYGRGGESDEKAHRESKTSLSDSKVRLTQPVTRTYNERDRVKKTSKDFPQSNIKREMIGDLSAGTHVSKSQLEERRGGYISPHTARTGPRSGDRIHQIQSGEGEHKIVAKSVDISEPRGRKFVYGEYSYTSVAGSGRGCDSRMNRNVSGEKINVVNGYKSVTDGQISIVSGDDEHKINREFVTLKSWKPNMSIVDGRETVPDGSAKRSSSSRQVAHTLTPGPWTAALMSLPRKERSKANEEPLSGSNGRNDRFTSEDHGITEYSATESVSDPRLINSDYEQGRVSVTPPVSVNGGEMDEPVSAQMPHMITASDSEDVGGTRPSDVMVQGSPLSAGSRNVSDINITETVNGGQTLMTNSATPGMTSFQSVPRANGDVSKQLIHTDRLSTAAADFSRWNIVSTGLNRTRTDENKSTDPKQIIERPANRIQYNGDTTHAPGEVQSDVEALKWQQNILHKSEVGSTDDLKSSGLKTLEVRSSSTASSHVSFSGELDRVRNKHVHDNTDIDTHRGGKSVSNISQINTLTKWKKHDDTEYISGSEAEYKLDNVTEMKRGIIYVNSPQTRSEKLSTSTPLSPLENIVQEPRSRTTLRSSQKHSPFSRHSGTSDSRFYMGVPHELDYERNASGYFEEVDMQMPTTSEGDSCLADRETRQGISTSYGTTCEGCSKETSDNNKAYEFEAHDTDEEIPLREYDMRLQSTTYKNARIPQQHEAVYTNNEDLLVQREVPSQPDSTDSVHGRKDGDVVEAGDNRDTLEGINLFSGESAKRAMHKVKSWITGETSQPFDRHSIAEIPLKIMTVPVPIEPTVKAEISHHPQISDRNGNESTGHEVSEENIQLDREVQPRQESEGSTNHRSMFSENLSNRQRLGSFKKSQTSLHKKKRKGPKPDGFSTEMVDLDPPDSGPTGTRRPLSYEPFFYEGLLEGWKPSSPYSHHIQKNPTTLSESGPHTVTGKTKIRQLSLAIGEEWEDMTGTQPVTDIPATSTSRSHRQVRRHQRSWDGSSVSGFLGRTIRYMSHPGRLENYSRRNNVVEGSDPVVVSPAASTDDLEAQDVQTQDEVKPQGRPDTEKRWLLPNPYNRINQRCHSTLQCPCCLFFCFLCCLPAVYFMQLSDKEFDSGSKKKSSVYGKRATILYVTGAIVSVITFTVVTSVAVVFLQDYLTRKQT